MQEELEPEPETERLALSFAFRSPDTAFLEASRFHPPDPYDTPATLYASRRSVTGVRAPRFVRLTDHRELLIYTDGACLFNGRDGARAGCGVVFGPESHSRFCFRLENRGPTYAIGRQASNRAELRAVVAVLQFRVWCGEGFSKLVIATDSSYVVEGATEWMRRWRENGWLTARGTPVQNRDLWEELRNSLAGTQEGQLQLWFWLIPRSWNAEADGSAGRGARMAAEEEYTQIMGVAC